MENFLPTFQWANILIVPGFLIGYTVHQLAHAFTAYALGDHSQVERGKLTLNPLRHISWAGTLGFIFLGPVGFIIFSWTAFLLSGKRWVEQLEISPQNFKKKYLGVSLVSIAGPIASFTFSLAALLLTLSVAALLVYTTGITTDDVFLFLFPPLDSLPQLLNLQAWTMAFTGYVVIASFWVGMVDILMDIFVFAVSLIRHFREQAPTEPQHNLTITAFSPNTQQPRGLINQYQRRNNVSDIHFKLGLEYHEKQLYDDAIARYRQAINNDQNFGPAYVNLGLAYAAKGKRREAIHSFRGTIQYADDQKSQNEAWYQLHQLSEVSPTDLEEAEAGLNELGSTPWTDTKPRPNWLSLGVGSGFLLVMSVAFYSYLLVNLIELLKV